MCGVVFHLALAVNICRSPTVLSLCLCCELKGKLVAALSYLHKMPRRLKRDPLAVRRMRAYINAAILLQVCLLFSRLSG